ncbi:hypothetical protein ASG87_01365 [Frateuria sp. Soil773]|nr:hypothetical protein ASG87_01365 [Frateuria sp. Soil773]
MTSIAEQRKKTKSKANTPLVPDVEKPEGPSFELRYSLDRAKDPNICVGGPTGDADGRIDCTVYRWSVEADGSAYWHIKDPKGLEADALKWLEDFAPHKANNRNAKEAAATLTTLLVGRGHEKAVPMADPKRNLVPLRGQYLSINDQGVITCLSPDPRYGVTYCVGASFDPRKLAGGVYTPQPVRPDSHFGRYLATTFADDDVRDLAQEAFSTVLINRCFEKSIWMYGEGENGKSVMLHIMTAVVGGRSAPVKLARLVRDHFGTAALHGARLATVAEVPKALTNEMQDTLKELFSWDEQPLERKGRDAFTFRPNAVWILASNAFPRVSQQEHGFWRKILTLPFTQRVPQEMKIADFHKLIVDNGAEMAQVIDWLLIGAQRLIRRGGKFGELPAAVVALAQQQRMESDPVVAFLDDSEALADSGTWTSKLAVYHAYREYCDERGKQPLGEPAFWVGVRGVFQGVDLEGRKGPSKKGKRERYVQLRVSGVQPLDRTLVPHSWSGLGLVVSKPAAPVKPAPVAFVPSVPDVQEWSSDALDDAIHF